MAAPGEPTIEACRLTKRYGDGAGAVTALCDVSFEIAAGEFVAVMGPSGSGKSSLMNLIGLLDEPSSGALRLAGTETMALSGDDRASLRNRHVGFVFQSYHLMPRRTALGNVELPLIYRGVPGKERRRLAEEELDRVSLLARRHDYPARMSGGEQQRVAIARALVTKPDVVIADEPTGALDTSTSEQVIGLLDSACSQGRTVMLVTHDPAVAMQASRLMIIQDGEIVRDDKPNESAVQRVAVRESTRIRCVS